MKAMKVTAAVVDQYVVKRKADGLAAGSINRELGILSSALRLAHDRGLVPSIPKIRRLPETTVREGHRRGKPLGRIEECWNTACRKAGVEGKVFHDLRRTAVRNMIRAGVPQHVAMMISGHRTTKMFHRYAIVDEQDLRSAAERMELYVDTLPTKR